MINKETKESISIIINNNDDDDNINNNNQTSLIIKFNPRQSFLYQFLIQQYP